MIAINSHPEPTLPNAPRLRGAMGRGEPGGGIACSRLSDSGEGVKEWGRRKSVGRFSFRIRAFHSGSCAFSIPQARLSLSLEQARGGKEPELRRKSVPSLREDGGATTEVSDAHFNEERNNQHKTGQPIPNSRIYAQRVPSWIHRCAGI